MPPPASQQKPRSGRHQAPRSRIDGCGLLSRRLLLASYGFIYGLPRNDIIFDRHRRRDGDGLHAGDAARDTGTTGISVYDISSRVAFPAVAKRAARHYYMMFRFHDLRSPRPTYIAAPRHFSSRRRFMRAGCRFPCTIGAYAAYAGHGHAEAASCTPELPHGRDSDDDVDCRWPASTFARRPARMPGAIQRPPQVFWPRRFRRSAEPAACSSRFGLAADSRLLAAAGRARAAR